jgi:hypothetical protein
MNMRVKCMLQTCEFHVNNNPYICKLFKESEENKSDPDGIYR